MKELNDTQLEQTSGGASGQYKEPSPAELKEINRLKQEIQNTINETRGASGEKVKELRKKHERLLNQLTSYIRVRNIDPKYRQRI